MTIVERTDVETLLGELANGADPPTLNHAWTARLVDPENAANGQTFVVEDIADDTIYVRRLEGIR